MVRSYRGAVWAAATGTSRALQYTAQVRDIYARRWRLLDRKNMTLDRAYEQSNQSPQSVVTGWAEIPLLPQHIWHDSQSAGFSGHTSTALGCPDPCVGVPSSAPMFRFASSSLNSALSPSVSSSNLSPIHLQKDCAPPYLTGNCGSPELNPGSSPIDIDFDNVNQDHPPTDPNRGSASIVIDMPLTSVGAHPSIRFSGPPNLAQQLPPANGSIPNNAHSHTNLPNIDVDVSCVSSALPTSVSPTLPAHDLAMGRCGPIPSLPETLTLEEFITPAPSSRSESAKPKRGKNGANYKLSSSLPVNHE